MSKYKLIIFDLDGTLLDTSEGILRSVKETISKYNLPKIGDDVIHGFIGPPIQNSFELFYGLTGSALQEVADYFRTIYSQNNLLFAKAYEGVYKLLKHLKDYGFIISVATYKREDYAIRLLKSFHFDDYTDIMYGADFNNNLKKEDIIFKCIDKAGIKTQSEVLMIGDTLHDYFGASMLGIDFLGVTYGFGFKNKEECSSLNCIAIVDTPLMIIKVLGD